MTTPSRYPSEQTLYALVEKSMDAISLVAADGTILYASAATTRLLGHALDDFVGRNAFDFMHPEDLARTRQLLADLLQKPGGSVTAQFRYRHKDGSWRWLESIGTNLLAEPGVQAIVGNYRDITDRKQAEESLRASEEKYRLMVENIDEVVYGVAVGEELTGDRVQYVSGRIKDIFGYEPAEFVEDAGLLMRIVHPEDIAHFVETTQRMRLRREGGTREYRLRHKLTGEYHWVEDKVIPRVDERGMVVGVQGVARDISERKRVEEQRRQLEAQIQQAQKLESLGVLAGGIAHDFNNLLAGILGNASLALQDLPPESPVRYSVQQIETAGLRAADLTKQMLAYAGKGRFVVQAINLSRVVEEMASLLRTVISKKASLHFDFAPNLRPVGADPTQVRQVVMNLITNASDALGDQNGTITLRTGVTRADRTYLATTYVQENLPEGYYAFLEVSDTGCGMDAATMGRVFEPFFTTKFTGRGLGMAAVLGIVRGHRGAIKVYSEPGKGTTFKVLFPSTNLSEEPVASVRPSAAAWRGSGTVLVIDDEQAVRDLATRILQKAGLTVLEAADGRHGLEIFRQHRDEILAVVLDLTMPHMNGEELFRQLRLLRPDIKVVLMSGYNEQQAINLFVGKGLAGFVQKPFRVEDFLIVLRRTLEKPLP